MLESGANSAGGAASGGGGAADPITAIANMVGDIFTSVSGVLISKNQEDISYNEWLTSNPTSFKWFYQSEEEKDNSGLVIIGVLAFIFIFLIGIITYIKMKRNV